MYTLFRYAFKALRRLKGIFYQKWKRMCIKIYYPGVIVNSKTWFGRGVTVQAMKGATIDIRGVILKDYAHVFAAEGADIIMGDDVEVGRFNMIVARNKIIIGARTLIAEFVTIRDQDHEIGDIKNFVVSPVLVGENVWIGNKVTITKGVIVGNGAVIGANSVVTKDIGAHSVAVGAPAKTIKTLRGADIKRPSLFYPLTLKSNG